MFALKPDTPEWFNKLMLRAVILFFVALFGFGLGLVGDKLEVEWLTRMSFATAAIAILLGVIIVGYGWIRTVIYLIGKLRGGNLTQQAKSKFEP